MWDIVCAIILVVFSLIGFVTVLKHLVLNILRPEQSNSVLVLFADKSSSENTEYTLRAWAARIKWMGKSAPKKVIISENGLKKEQKEICRRICKEYKFMSMENTEGIIKIMDKKDT